MSNFGSNKGYGRGSPVRAMPLENNLQSTSGNIPIATSYVTAACWLEREVTVPYSVINITRQWFDELHTSYRTKQNYEEFCDILNNCLNRTDSLYWSILHLVASCPYYLKSVSKFESMTSFLVRGFQEYLARSVTKPRPPSNEVKLAAFLVAFRQKHNTVFESIFNVFDLSENPEIFIPLIMKEIEMKRYDVAYHAVTSLKLQSHFTPVQILFPLLLQEKFTEMDSYVAGNVEWQRQLVYFLDSFCIPNSGAEAMAEQLQIPNAKKARLKLAAMNKLVKRFVKKFNVPKEYWPNVRRQQGNVTISFILAKKYIENSIGDEDFDDMVTDIVGNSRELQLELVIEMGQYNDANGAARYAVMFQVPNEKLPDSVRSAIENGAYNEIKTLPTPPPTASSAAASNWYDPIPYADWTSGVKKCGLPQYSPSIPTSESFQLIDNPQQFQNEIEKIIRRKYCVGIDCEWKPTFGSHTERLSLIQVATEDDVLIIDILTMRSNLSNKHWFPFIDLLSDQSIRKLGFSFDSDLKMLSATHPTLFNLSKVTTNLLDLKFLCDKVLDRYPEIFPYYNGELPTSLGLDTYVELCLGVTLDKKEQLSNWERRPLYPKQITYAGVDAYCLLDLYRVLQTRAQELQYDLMSLTNLRGEQSVEASSQSASRNAARGQMSQRKPFSGIACSHQHHVGHGDGKRPRFVVDNMLQGLGHQLRLCGFDTIVLDNDTDHDEASKIALKDRRIILSSNAPYLRLSKLVPNGMCYYVDCSHSAKIQLQEILKIFDIQLTEDDIFRRCTVCNGGRYLNVPKSDFNDHTDWKSSRKLYNKVTLDYGTMQLDNGVRVQIENVPRFVWENPGVNFFNICIKCGKMYWEGTHRKRIANHLGI